MLPINLSHTQSGISCAEVQSYPNCKGTGQVTRSRGLLSISTTCEQCRGEGTIIPHPCKECKGLGRASKSKKVKIRIPPRGRYRLDIENILPLRTIVTKL
ncbi:MAG: zinc finger domain-containing protein [Thermodesulfobacteriota bacterium]